MDIIFSGLRICGANFSGTFDMEKIVNDKFEKLETILTQEEFKRLFEFDEKNKQIRVWNNNGRYKIP